MIISILTRKFCFTASDQRGPRHSLIQKEEKLSNEVKEIKNTTPNTKKPGLEQGLSLYKRIKSKVTNGGSGSENQNEQQTTDSKSNFKNTGTTVNKSQDAEKRVSLRKTSTTSERDSRGMKSGNVNRPQSNETKKPPVKNPLWKN